MFKLNFRLPSLILVTLFLLVLSPLKSADDLSGGTVLFDDEVSSAVKQANENTVQTKANEIKKEQLEKEGKVAKDVTPIALPNKKEDLAQVDSTQENIQPNYKRMEREQYLDENSMFKANQEQSFYGINLLVLKINVKRDKSGKIIGFLPENETQPVSYTNERNNPDYFLNIERNNYRSRNYTKAELYQSHKALLRSFVKRIPRDKDAVIIMYVNGSNLKNYSAKEMQLEKMIYAQFVTDFLYRNKRKLTIERRYVDDVPENEIFMVISKYEGNIPPNIYNASKGNILQWLARYKELERQKITGANSSRANLEQTLNSTTASKNPDLLLAPVERKIEVQNYDIQMSEEDLYKVNTRKVKPRETVRGNTGPRRVLPPEEEVTEEEIEADENAELNKENQEAESEDAENSNPTPATATDGATGTQNQTSSTVLNPNAGIPVNRANANQ